MELLDLAVVVEHDDGAVPRAVVELGPQGGREDDLDEALDRVDVALHALGEHDVAEVVGDGVEAAGAAGLFSYVTTCVL